MRLKDKIREVFDSAVMVAAEKADDVDSGMLSEAELRLVEAVAAIDEDDPTCNWFLQCPDDPDLS